MRIGIREFKDAYEVVEVIPRSDGPVCFKARAVLDFSDFDKLCPVPIPPFVKRPNQATIQNVQDPKFLAEINEYSRKKTAWTVIESLKATPELVWDKVKADQSSTWTLWSEELREAKFTESEITRLFRAVTRANSLDEDHLEKVRRDFFLMQAEQNILSSQKDAPANTPSGEPAKG